MASISGTTTMRPRPWTVQGLADYLEVRPKAVYALIADGRLRAVRVGRNYRIADETVQAFLAGDTTDAA